MSTQAAAARDEAVRRAEAAEANAAASSAAEAKAKAQLANSEAARKALKEELAKAKAAAAAAAAAARSAHAAASASAPSLLPAAAAAAPSPAKASQAAGNTAEVKENLDPLSPLASPARVARSSATAGAAPQSPAAAEASSERCGCDAEDSSLQLPPAAPQAPAKTPSKTPKKAVSASGTIAQRPKGLAVLNGTSRAAGPVPSTPRSKAQSTTEQPPAVRDHSSPFDENSTSLATRSGTTDLFLPMLPPNLCRRSRLRSASFSVSSCLQSAWRTSASRSSSSRRRAC